MQNWLKMEFALPAYRSAVAWASVGGWGCSVFGCWSSVTTTSGLGGRLEQQGKERKSEEEEQSSSDESGQEVDRHIIRGEENSPSLHHLLLDEVISCQLGKRRWKEFKIVVTSDKDKEESNL